MTKNVIQGKDNYPSKIRQRKSHPQGQKFIPAEKVCRKADPKLSFHFVRYFLRGPWWNDDPQRMVFMQRGEYGMQQILVTAVQPFVVSKVEVIGPEQVKWRKTRSCTRKTFSVKCDPTEESRTYKFLLMQEAGKDVQGKLHCH